MMTWLGQAVFQGGFMAYPDLAALFVFYALLLFCGIVTVSVCLDNKLVLKQDGLHVPAAFFLEMNYSCVRPWKELRVAEFKNEQLILSFVDGTSVFKVKGIKAGDLKDLVIAIRTNSPETRCMFDRKSIGMGIAGIKAGPDDKTFTSVWEEDLAVRFGSTAFVPLETNTQLQDGRLKVIGQVSFGGLSAIYLCKDNLGETMILKEAVLPANSPVATREKALEMFKREASILQGLNNVHIVRVYDNFVEKGRHYMLLEHVEGLDLRQYVRELGVQSERVIIRWALETAEILEYLHTQTPPVVHRDLTPDNLVLDRTGSIKLIDFGAANVFIGTATGTLVGKQSYISPEQFRGKASAQSDIYSLGCTLYYLATGKDPDALSQSELPEPLRASMPSLNALIKKATELELEDRFQNAGEIVRTTRDYFITQRQEA
jgi:hypothetical protein